MLPSIKTRAFHHVWLLLVIALGLGLDWSSALQDPVTKHKTGDQEESTVHPQSLERQEAVILSAPAPRAVEATEKCDQHGNIYLVYYADVGAIYNLPSGSLPLSRVSFERKTVVQHAIQNIPGYQTIHRVYFDVSPSGTVYALAKGYPHLPGNHPEPPDMLIVKFASDGTVDSTVKLNDPPGGHLNASLFAVFSGGSYLVTGVLRFDPGRSSSRPFTGIFDSYGRLVRELGLPSDVHASSDLGSSSSETTASPEAGAEGKAGQGHERAATKRGGLNWTMQLSQGRAVGAPDGNVYLLRATSPPRLYVLSPGGEVLGSVGLKFRDAGMSPMTMSLAGDNRLFVQFGHLPTRAHDNGGRPDVLALFDLSTGDLTATVGSPQDPDIMSMACATPQNEFLFLGTAKDNHLEVVKFVPR